MIHAMRRICVCGVVVHVRQLINILVPFCSGLDLWFCEQFPAAGLVGGLVLFGERNTSMRGWLVDLVLLGERITSIITSHKSRASNPPICSPAIQHKDFWFCRNVENWRLFLTHPTDGDKCSTSKDTWDSLRSWFWVLKITSKIWVWE